MRLVWWCLGIVLLSVSAGATTIQLQSVEGFIHYGGGSTPQVSLNQSSPEFVTGLDANNLGSFQFVWTNTTGGDLANLSFTLFLDPDIDRDDNTFFNEYGELVSNSLPVLAPLGAVGFTNWEIDEPEYTFGNIYTHSLAGTLDNLVGVPSSAPDDVSHALQFFIPALLDGQTMRVFGTLSLTDAAGLAQVDPDSNVTLYVNGYALLDAAPTSGVPEPGTYALLGAGLLVLERYRRAKCN